MTKPKPAAFIPRPSTRKAAPIGMQPDMFGGAEVPAFADTAIGREMRRLRLVRRLSAAACGRACGFTASEWRQIEDGELLVLDTPADALAGALEREENERAFR